MVTEDVYCKGGYEKSDSISRKNMTYLVNGIEKRGVFANLICYQLNRDGIEFQVADVGGGFKEKDRKEIQAALDIGIINPKNPLVIEVKANGRNDSLKLRSPNFLRIRNDKAWSQCIIKEMK